MEPAVGGVLKVRVPMLRPKEQPVRLNEFKTPGLKLAQDCTTVFLQLEANCGTPHAGIEPLAIGVISTAKVRPKPTEPAEAGSNEIPAPDVVVPVTLAEVELVPHPAGTVLPVGQVPVAFSLQYQRHV